MIWLKPDFENIPPELKSIANWVLAKAIPRDGKVTKPPFQPNHQPASVSDPSTWSTFEEVRAAYEMGGFIGIGLVLDGKPHFDGKYLHGFDWDKCIINGSLDSKVKAILKTLKIPRLEISISGKGIRGFFLHDEPLVSRRTIISGMSVELYSNNRYLTTTGIGKGVLS